MTTKRVRNKLALAAGAALAGSLAGISVAAADSSPFSMTELSSGYLVADAGGAEKGEEGKCGEGKCGAEKGEDAQGDKGAEGKCGEGKCGGDA